MSLWEVPRFTTRGVIYSRSRNPPFKYLVVESETQYEKTIFNLVATGYHNNPPTHDTGSPVKPRALKMGKTAAAV